MKTFYISFLIFLVATVCFSQSLPEKISMLRIAVVQQDGNPGQLELNRNKQMAFAKQALEQNADVILFQEELLLGYVNNIAELAEPMNGSTTRAFHQVLKNSDVFIIHGLTEKAGTDFYITAVAVSQNGIETYYRKIHLCGAPEGDPRDEPSFFSAGNELVALYIKRHRSGIIICYDGDFPKMTTRYANLDCSILFWMNKLGSRGNEEVKNLARRNSIFIPSSCTTGINEKGDFCPGGSNIIGPKGKVFSVIWNKEGILIADILPDEAMQLRAINRYYIMI